MGENSTVLKPVGEALHVYFDSIVKEPLPRRWIDLINWLNEQERAQAEAELHTGSSRDDLLPFTRSPTTVRITNAAQSGAQDHCRPRAPSSVRD